MALIGKDGGCDYTMPRVLCSQYSLHEDIKRALLWSSEGVEESDGAFTCEEVFSRALTCALRRDGEEEDDPVVKAGKRTERYVKCFGAYVHVSQLIYTTYTLTRM